MFKQLYLYIKKIIINKLAKQSIGAHQYLSKYVEPYILSKQEGNTEHSNYIWQFWWQGKENVPLIVKRCMKSVQKFNPSKNIVIVDKNNIADYIDIPDFILEKYKKGIIPNAHFADYIRVALIEKYGGLWLDATVLLTKPIPEEIFEQDFFILKNKLWHEFDSVPSESLYKVFLKLDRNFAYYGSNWFIYAHKNNLIIKLIKQILEDYWKNENKLVHYFIFHHLMSILIIKNAECRKIYENMLSLSNRKSFMLESIFHDKFNIELYNEITENWFVHKLSYKYKTVEKNSFIEKILEGVANG